MNISIYVKQGHGFRFVGKVISKEFVRDVDMRKAVLWKTGEVSFDRRAWDYILHKVDKVVFVDKHKKEAFEVSVQDILANSRFASYGSGEQVYFKKNLMKPIPFKSYPYINKCEIL